MKRRELLIEGIQLGRLGLLGYMAPIASCFTIQAKEATPQSILIRQYLGGGLDPFAVLLPKDSASQLNLKRMRPNLLFQGGLPIPGDEQFLLNPKLKNLHSILKKGGVRIFVGTGSGSESLSHFENIALIENPSNKEGILSGALNEMRPNSSRVGALSFNYNLPAALQGRSFALTPHLFFNMSFDSIKAQFSLNKWGCVDASDPYCDYLSHIRSNQDYLQKLVPARSSNSMTTGLDFTNPKALTKIVQTIVNDNLDIPFVTRDFVGFDTHAGQVEALDDLLTDWDDQIGVLYDLIVQNKKRSILLFTYSEFGRCLQENGARGSEHGRGGISFVFGVPKALSGGPILSVPKDALTSSEYLPSLYPIQDLYREILTKRYGISDVASDRLLPSSTKKVPPFLA